MSNSVVGPLIAIVADDEELGRLLLAESAKAAGLTPLVFDNGSDALAAALVNDAAIILLDVDMPGLDGFTVCRRIRSAKRASLPIVMVTGLNDKAAINSAFEAGATDFISKPVNWSLLSHRLAYMLRNSERESKVATFVDALPDALWVVSPTGDTRWSQNTSKLSFRNSAARPGADADLAVAVPPERLAEVLRNIAQTAADAQIRALELRHTAIGSEQDQSSELRFSRCEGGDVLVVRQDTSERTASAARIEHLAYFDGLTGLPNRQHCIEVASRYLASSAETNDRLAFLYLDLNGFKRINDTFGHSVGDIVLQRVATALLDAIRTMSSAGGPPFLARLGGDEFIVIIRDEQAREKAIETAQTICTLLEKPIVYGTLEFIAGPSVGLAIYPEDGTDVETLLKHADTAMYQAKAMGGAKIAAYTAAMSASVRDSLELESRLRRAVREGGLDLRYQPKIRLRDGVLVGAEALIRWFDTELGEISPSRFIPIAEDSGLIVDIGAWIMRTVATQLGIWQRAGIEIPIAVNVSGKELLFSDPSKVIKSEAERSGIAASLIEAEITESVFVSDSTAARTNIDKIRHLGCRIALDDFGTGYSSLSYLSRFPPDRLKIDRSFIQDVDRSGSDGAIVKAILSLGKALNILVTAEGIERKGQLQWLKQGGCDEAQGYLIARPLAASQFEADFLKRRPPSEEHRLVGKG